MKNGYDLADEMFTNIRENENHEPSIEDTLRIISFWGFNETVSHSDKIGFVCYCAENKIKKILEQALIYGDFSLYDELEKQIRQIKNYGRDIFTEQSDWQESLYMAIEAISKALEQKPKTGWIPVSERLPEENETVMASTKFGVYPEVRYSKEYGWEWAYEAGADYWKELKSTVTAWTPLPSPYDPQESEG